MADRRATLDARDGFVQALRAEWTKFRSVRSTVWTVVATVGLTVGLAVLTATGSRTNANEGPSLVDTPRFVHTPLAGDGSVVAHVLTQQDSHEWAKAGIMIKDGVPSGSPYAAIMVTPDHGVRLQGNFDTEVTASTSAAPYWLRLTRSGASVTGYESADGATWTEVGTVDLGTLPRTVEAGLFVASPPNERIVEEPTSISVFPVETVSVATFDNVSVVPTGSPPSAPALPNWTDTDLGAQPTPSGDQAASQGGPIQGGFTQAGGIFTVTGSGDLGDIGVGGIESGADDDIVLNALIGVQIGLMAVVALGALFMTSEYRTSTIRATFAASPRRGRVLAAKATVVGATVFVAGLVGSVAAFFAVQPIQHRRGFEPPAYPHPSLADPTVLRAVVGTALFLAVLALFSLGVGAVVRRTAGAITFVLALVVVPQIVASVLSVDATRWIQRVTPIAGLAIQQTRHRVDTAIGPWAGFGVLCAYAAFALAVGVVLLRKRDA